MLSGFLSLKMIKNLALLQQEMLYLNTSKRKTKKICTQGITNNACQKLGISTHNNFTDAVHICASMCQTLQQPIRVHFIHHKYQHKHFVFKLSTLHVAFL